MIATPAPKKKKRSEMSKADRTAHEAITKLLWYLKHEWQVFCCGEYHPECSNCHMYILRGHLEKIKSDLEFI